MYLCYFLLLCMLTAGCSHTIPSGGDRIKVKSGDTFEVKLESQVATGYRWQLSEDLDARYFELVETKYEPAKEDVDGSLDTEIWIFKALRAGKTNIHLLYNPAWQQEKAPDDKTRTHEVTIE